MKFESEDGGTTVECAYDSMGRRFEKKVTVGGTTGFHARYLYRDYLQVAECDLTGETPEVVRSYIWDPSEPEATRVLSMTRWEANGTQEKEHLYCMHDELGLVYYNYRHLNPHDGRWISRDPIEEQGGWNLFAFVNNNGIINIDLLGLLSFMSCVRFPDLSMICLISIFEGLCVCPECKKIADKMYKAKSFDTLLEEGNELVKWAKNQKMIRLLRLK